MRRLMLFAAVALLLVPGAVLAANVRHSGTVLGTAPASRTLTFEEMGPWTGPGTRPAKRTVTLVPQTPIRLMHRDRNVVTGPDPDWTSSPLTLADIKPGDFVTVTTEPGRTVAVAVDVVHPSDQPQ